MSDRERGWVAGFLEGEGSFFLNPRPRISATNTEFESLIRLKRYTGVGEVTGLRPQYHEHHKPQKAWRVVRQLDVLGLSLALFTEMSSSRRRQLHLIFSYFWERHPKYFEMLGLDPLKDYWAISKLAPQLTR